MQFQPDANDKNTFDKLSNILTPVLNEFGIKQEEFNIQTKTIQYVLRAVKSEYKIKPLLIQTIIGEEKLCSRVRIVEPHSFCSTIPGIRSVEKIKNADLSIASLYEKKVFIWQRIWPQSPDQQKQILSRNYLVLGEIDDDPLRWEAYHKEN